MGKFNDMTGHHMLLLKEFVSDIFLNQAKQWQLSALQKSLRKRPDFTLDSLTNVHHVQLEILVALKTGLQEYLLQKCKIPSSDLAEIFLYRRCRNVTCRSLLPVVAGSVEGNLKFLRCLLGSQVQALHGHFSRTRSGTVKKVCTIWLLYWRCRPIQITKVVLGTDSHTCTTGAFGQFSTGIGNTDAGFVLGNGKLLLKMPPTLRFVMDGELPDYLLGKYLILQGLIRFWWEM